MNKINPSRALMMLTLYLIIRGPNIVMAGLRNTYKPWMAALDISFVLIEIGVCVLVKRWDL